MKTTANHKKVKELRENRGWSQDQLSEMSGLSLRTIQRMEKDGHCSIESVKSLASVFNIDFKELLEEKSSKQFHDTEFLVRLQAGKQIADMIQIYHGYDFNFENSIKDQKLIELCYSFFQTIMEWAEIWDDIEFGGRSEAIEIFQKFVDELHYNDLWIFGGQTKKNQGNFKSPLIFDVMILRIHPKDSATIIKFDLSQPTVSEVNSN